jgi:hypothetical protein
MLQGGDSSSNSRSQGACPFPQAAPEAGMCEKMPPTEAAFIFASRDARGFWIWVAS